MRSASCELDGVKFHTLTVPSSFSELHASMVLTDFGAEVTEAVPVAVPEVVGVRVYAMPIDGYSLDDLRKVVQ